MKKTTAVLTQVLPVIATLIVFCLVPSIAHAYAVSCGPEGSTGHSFYPSSYTVPVDANCYDIFATVYAYKDCINQDGYACRITWDENYMVSYTQTSYYPYYNYCSLYGGTWFSNSNIVDPC